MHAFAAVRSDLQDIKQSLFRLGSFIYPRDRFPDELYNFNIQHQSNIALSLIDKPSLQYRNDLPVIKIKTESPSSPIPALSIDRINNIAKKQKHYEVSNCSVCNKKLATHFIPRHLRIVHGQIKEGPSGTDKTLQREINASSIIDPNINISSLDNVNSPNPLSQEIDMLNNYESISINDTEASNHPKPTLSVQNGDMNNSEKIHKKKKKRITTSCSIDCKVEISTVERSIANKHGNEKKKRRKPSEKSTENPPKNEFVCPYCPAEFPTFTKLNLHLCKMHRYMYVPDNSKPVGSKEN